MSLYCRYLVTFSTVVENPQDPQNIIIWDVKIGTKKRSFTATSAEEWPIIKYVKRITLYRASLNKPHIRELVLKYLFVLHYLKSSPSQGRPTLLQHSSSIHNVHVHVHVYTCNSAEMNIPLAILSLFLVSGSRWLFV